jgi:hypothetical protein
LGTGWALPPLMPFPVISPKLSIPPNSSQLASRLAHCAPFVEAGAFILRMHSAVHGLRSPIGLLKASQHIRRCLNSGQAADYIFFPQWWRGKE